MIVRLAILLAFLAGDVPAIAAQAPSYTDTAGNPQGSIGVMATPATGTGGASAATVGTSSAQVQAAAARSAMLAIQNVSATASVACALGSVAALNTAGSFQIPAGQMLTLSNGAYVPGDAINCIASAAATPVTIYSK